MPIPFMVSQRLADYIQSQGGDLYSLSFEEGKRWSRLMRADELYGQTHCDLCGEMLIQNDSVEQDIGEMYDASMLRDPEMWSETRRGIVHAQCGIDAGWEIA
jgi:hypothetical protein